MDIQNAIAPNIEVPKSVDNAIGNLTDKPTKEIGSTFADLWYLIFGGLSERAEKKRLKVTQNIEEYKRELYTEVNKIPKEFRQEPKLQIAGPALQKSQYCVEEKELREMFVKLISRSMDKSFDSKIRPSFAEIISQMAPIDAQNLRLFQGPKHDLLPLCEYKLVLSGQGYIAVKTNVFLQNPEITDLDVQATSISELSQLGLVSISYDIMLTDPKEYDIFENNSCYKVLKKYVKSSSEDLNKTLGANKKITDAIIQKGSVKLTPLGRDFLDVCLTDHITVAMNKT